MAPSRVGPGNADPPRAAPGNADPGSADPPRTDPGSAVQLAPAAACLSVPRQQPLDRLTAPSGPR